VALLGLPPAFVAAGDTTLVTSLLAGLAAAVLAIVAQAVVRVGDRALGHPSLVVLAVAAFASFWAFAIAFPVVIAAATVIGWTLGCCLNRMFLAKRPTSTSRQSQAGDRHFKSYETRDNLVSMGDPLPNRIDLRREPSHEAAIRCSYLFRSSIDGSRSFG
jgi:chromate transport protein ChrA